MIVPIYAKVSIFIHHSSNSKIKEKNKGSSNALLYNQIEDWVIYKQWSLTQISGVLNFLHCTSPLLLNARLYTEFLNK
jgi:hypothetical protein